MRALVFPSLLVSYHVLAVSSLVDDLLSTAASGTAGCAMTSEPGLAATNITHELRLCS